MNDIFHYLILEFIEELGKYFIFSKIESLNKSGLLCMPYNFWAIGTTFINYIDVFDVEWNHFKYKFTFYSMMLNLYKV